MSLPLAREREAVVATARRLRGSGLVVGTAGNVSARRGDLVAITPSAVDYDDLRPEEIAVVHVDGTVLGGGPASTELPLHLAAYAATGAGAVVHTHSPYATALSTVADRLPAVHYTIVDLGGPVPILPYRTPGTAALAEQLADALADRAAVILGNHGTVTIGPRLERAFDRSVLLEELAGLYHRACALGQPKVVGESELAEVAQRLQGYFDGGRPAGTVPHDLPHDVPHG